MEQHQADLACSKIYEAFGQFVEHFAGPPTPVDGERGEDLLSRLVEADLESASARNHSYFGGRGLQHAIPSGYAGRVHFPSTHDQEVRALRRVVEERQSSLLASLVKGASTRWGSGHEGEFLMIRAAQAEDRHHTPSLDDLWKIVWTASVADRTRLVPRPSEC